MFEVKDSPIRKLAVVTLLGTFVLISTPPKSSALAGQIVLAQAAPAQISSAGSPDEGAATAIKAREGVDEKVEARIKAMHSDLGVTPAQDAQWNALAQVMRDNAHAVGDIRQTGSEQTESMSAIDQIKSYSAITEAQAAGIQKFLPAFQALYDSMSDAQKKSADELFRSRALAESKKAKAKNS